MGYFSDKSDVVRLLAEDLREEHGEEPETVWPLVVGVLVGGWLTWWMVGLL
jgi:hypothetical protein